MARESSITTILSGSPLAIYFYFIYLSIYLNFFFFFYLTRCVPMGCEAQMSPSLKGSTLFFYEGGGGCSCSVVILS